MNHSLHTHSNEPPFMDRCSSSLYRYNQPRSLQTTQQTLCCVHWRENVIDEQKKHHEEYHTLTDNDRDLADRSIYLSIEIWWFVAARRLPSCAQAARSSTRLRRVQKNNFSFWNKKERVSEYHSIKRSDVFVDLNLDFILQQMKY